MTTKDQAISDLREDNANLTQLLRLATERLEQARSIAAALEAENAAAVAICEATIRDGFACSPILAIAGALGVES